VIVRRHSAVDAKDAATGVVLIGQPQVGEHGLGRLGQRARKSGDVEEARLGEQGICLPLQL